MGIIQYNTIQYNTRCLNYCINILIKIGSISSGATTSMVVKNRTKKTFEGFLNVLNVLNMSHRNGSSAFVFQVTGILKLVTVSTDKGLQLSHGRLQLTLWVKFGFPYDQFLPSALS